MTTTDTPRANAPDRRSAPAAGLFGGCPERDRPVEALRTATGHEILSADQRQGFARLFGEEGGTLHPA